MSDKIKSDGGSSSYYHVRIPPKLLDQWNETGTIEVRHVGRLFLDNCFAKVNIFKALVRLGKKSGVSVDYDINKSHFFLDDIKEAIEQEND